MQRPDRCRRLQTLGSGLRRASLWRFICASTLRAIVTQPGFRREVNEPFVAGHMCGFAISDSGTVYKDVFPLKPGHVLRITGRP